MVKDMYETSLKFLNEISDYGKEGYIVGGYPRDKYLNVYSDDIDICTNMKPEELKMYFNVIAGYDMYGSYKILYDGFIFEVTTYRKEGIYNDHRAPNSVEFINDLKEDLKRRDFIINTLCIDKFGNYLDLLNARKDIDNKIIKVVGDTNKKLSEDPLRIIRAIRFKYELNFNLDKELEEFIINNKNLLNYVSEYHVKKELDKITNNEIRLEVLNYLKKLTNTDFLV